MNSWAKTRARRSPLDCLPQSWPANKCKVQRAPEETATDKHGIHIQQIVAASSGTAQSPSQTHTTTNEYRILDSGVLSLGPLHPLRAIIIRLMCSQRAQHPPQPSHKGTRVQFTACAFPVPRRLLTIRAPFPLLFSASFGLRWLSYDTRLQPAACNLLGPQLATGARYSRPLVPSRCVCVATCEQSAWPPNARGA